MALPNGFDLATDAAFRLVAGFTEPPKAGVVVGLETNGQYAVEVDTGEGGTVRAWPLNGFDYGPGAVVYVLFAANAPESGIILGSLAPLPTLATPLVVKAPVSPATDLLQVLFHDHTPALRVHSTGVTEMPQGWRSYFQTVADNSVFSFAPPGGGGLLFLAGGTEADAASLAGVIAFRAATMPFCASVATGVDIEVTTGTLNGTTGNSGKMTVAAAADGSIYVENRTGSSRGMWIGVMG